MWEWTPPPILNSSQFPYYSLKALHFIEFWYNSTKQNEQQSAPSTLLENQHAAMLASMDSLAEILTDEEASFSGQKIFPFALQMEKGMVRANIYFKNNLIK